MTTPTVQAALDALIDAIRAELRAEFLSALGGPAAAPRPRTARAKATERSRRAAAPRAKGAKRTPEELEELTKNLLAYVKKNPGQRVEQIAEALGTGTKDLALPVRKLGKALRTRGQRRGTKYFAR